MLLKRFENEHYIQWWFKDEVDVEIRKNEKCIIHRRGYSSESNSEGVETLEDFFVKKWGIKQIIENNPETKNEAQEIIDAAFLILNHK